jgi:hypothetical protein
MWDGFGCVSVIFAIIEQLEYNGWDVHFSFQGEPILSETSDES